eukprot:1263616-Amphidinium_carterae.1
MKRLPVIILGETVSGDSPLWHRVVLASRCLPLAPSASDGLYSDRAYPSLSSFPPSAQVPLLAAAPAPQYSIQS